jgi:hypothetical protein
VGKFQNLRVEPWEPTFTWVPTAKEAADRINSFHEDYPRRVPMTLNLLELPFRGPWAPGKVATQEVQALALGAVHWFLFNPEPHAGRLRQVNVRVGRHRPPDSSWLPRLMAELEEAYRGQVQTVDDLIAWYTDFETIHPFQDGNGRVGGIVVASFAHAKHPDQGWLAANQ